MKKKLAEIWGFDFPDDLFDVWTVARRIDAKHPRDAFLDLCGVRLEGPFVVLDGGRLESDRGRWTSDPPELFTIASGDSDGLHWGYVVHEPGKSAPVCAHFYARDSADISIDGTFYGALRERLRDVRDELAEELAESREVGELDREVEKRIAAIDRALAIVVAKKTARPKLPKGAAEALDTLAIVCTPSQYERPYRFDGAKLVAALRDPKKRAALVAKAYALVARGKPGGALHVARDLYFALPEKEQAVAAELLRHVYDALDRPALVRALEHVKPPKKSRSKKPRVCSTLAEALEDLATVGTLAITYHSADRTAPSAAHFRAMKQLRCLVLRGCTVPDLAIAGLPIERLELFQCKVKSLAALAKLPRLEELTLVGGTTPLPRGLALPKLRRLQIARPDLTSVPDFVLGAKGLYNLSLHGRIGALPDAIGELSSLSYVSLSQNRLAALPDVFDRLPKLSSLWLDGNRLTALPESIAACKKTLRSLSIGKNPLVKNAAERARIKALLPKTKTYWT